MLFLLFVLVILIFFLYLLVFCFYFLLFPFMIYSVQSERKDLHCMDLVCCFFVVVQQQVVFFFICSFFILQIDSIYSPNRSKMLRNQVNWPKHIFLSKIFYMRKNLRSQQLIKLSTIVRIFRMDFHSNTLSLGLMKGEKTFQCHLFCLF